MTLALSATLRLNSIKRAGHRTRMHDCHIPEKEREHVSEEEDVLENIEVDGECCYEGCYRFAPDA